MYYKGYGDQPLFTVHTGWYYFQEIQLPMELGLMHLCLLAVLEKRKNIIGRVMHYLLLRVTHYLGIARMILPFKMCHINWNEEAPVPMKRPPKGWDSRKRADVVSISTIILILNISPR